MNILEKGKMLTVQYDGDRLKSLLDFLDKQSLTKNVFVIDIALLSTKIVYNNKQNKTQT